MSYQLHLIKCPFCWWCTDLQSLSRPSTTPLGLCFFLRTIILVWSFIFSCYVDNHVSGQFCFEGKIPGFAVERLQNNGNIGEICRFLLLHRLVLSPCWFSLFPLNNELHPKDGVHWITCDSRTWAQFRGWFIIHWSFNNLAAGSRTYPIRLLCSKQPLVCKEYVLGHSQRMCLQKGKVHLNKTPGRQILAWSLHKAVNWSAGMFGNIIWKAWHWSVCDSCSGSLPPILGQAGVTYGFPLDTASLEQTPSWSYWDL